MDRGKKAHAISLLHCIHMRMRMAVLQALEKHTSLAGPDIPLGCGQAGARDKNFGLVRAPEHLPLGTSHARRDREFGECPIDPPP